MCLVLFYFIYFNVYFNFCLSNLCYMFYVCLLLMMCSLVGFCVWCKCVYSMFDFVWIVRLLLLVVMNIGMC